MKTIEILTFRGLQALTVILGFTIVIAFAYAMIQIAIGNIPSSSSREF